jgi:hypothetical protein
LAVVPLLLRNRAIKKWELAMATETNGHVRELSPEEGRKLFDEAARFYLNISGDEFIRAWEAGEYDDDPDRSEVMSMAMLLPFAQ